MQRIGLTKEEAQITLVLLDMCESTASELCETTEIPKSRIYYVLESLERLGVIYTEYGSPKIYKLTNPVEAFDNLRSLETAKYEKKIMLIDKFSDHYSDSKENSSRDIDQEYTLREKNHIFDQFRQFIDEAAHSIKLKEIYKDIQDKFRNVFDKSSLGLKLYNQNGELLETNQAWYTIFGLNTELEKERLLEEEFYISKENLRNLHRGINVEYESEFDFDELNGSGALVSSKTGIIPLKFTIIPMILKSDDTLSGFLVQVQDQRYPEEDKKFDDILKIKQVNSVLFNWLKKLNCPSCMPKVEKELDKIFIEIANTIKNECSSPTPTSIRIIIEDKYFCNKDFKETPLKYQDNILVNHQRRGKIEVFTQEKQSITSKDQDMIKSVSRLLGSFLLLHDKLN